VAAADAEVAILVRNTGLLSNRDIAGATGAAPSTSGHLRALSGTENAPNLEGLVGGNTRDGSTPFSRIESSCKSRHFNFRTQDLP
jgi:hypothetical protein